MADGNIIKAVKNIVQSDIKRKFIVVSAPGKRYSTDTKVTDLLYKCHKTLLSDGSCKRDFAPVRARFNSIVKELGITFDIASVLDETEKRIDLEHSIDFTASRGEYLCARIVAEVLGAKFIDSANVIYFDKEGAFSSDKSYKAIYKACQSSEFYVISGFYGRGYNGKVKTFSRGGSDITGAIVARAVHASLYENWTDVSGFYACDPKIVSCPKLIKNISYNEFRELSRMGASVVHGDSVLPVREADIPIRIKNTFRPQDEGTLIVPNLQHVFESDSLIGIAGKKAFTVIHIKKSLKEEEHCFISDALKLLSSESIAVEHVISGIDSLNLIIESSQLSGVRQRVIKNIKNKLRPDGIKITENIALIATVGRGDNCSAGSSVRALSALSAANIKVKFISQCSDRFHIIIGVDDSYYEKCVRVLYSEFFTK